MDTATSPESHLRYSVADRSGQADVDHAIDTFQLRSGPSDVTSYHDFHNLQIAFQSIWTEMFDGQLGTLGKDLYREFVKLKQFNGVDAGVDPSINTIADLEELLSHIKEFAKDTVENIPGQIPRRNAGQEHRWHGVDVHCGRHGHGRRRGGRSNHQPQATVGDCLRLFGASDRLASRRTPGSSDRRGSARRTRAHLHGAGREHSRRSPRQNQQAVSVAQPVERTACGKVCLRRFCEGLDELRYPGDIPTGMGAGQLSGRRSGFDDPARAERDTAVHDQGRHEEEQGGPGNRQLAADPQAGFVGHVARRCRNRQQRTAKTNFTITATESLGGGEVRTILSSTQTASQDQSKSSQQVKKEFRESVLKSARSTGRSIGSRSTPANLRRPRPPTFHEIQNPNDELTVTYLF